MKGGDQPVDLSDLQQPCRRRPVDVVGLGVDDDRVLALEEERGNEPRAPAGHKQTQCTADRGKDPRFSKQLANEPPA